MVKLDSMYKWMKALDLVDTHRHSEVVKVLDGDLMQRATVDVANDEVFLLLAEDGIVESEEVRFGSTAGHDDLTLVQQGLKWDPDVPVRLIWQVTVRPRRSVARGREVSYLVPDATCFPLHICTVLQSGWWERVKSSVVRFDNDESELLKLGFGLFHCLAVKNVQRCQC